MNEDKIQITLEDFPDDIYILLEDNFRADFFKTAWKINKSYRHLAKRLEFPIQSCFLGEEEGLILPTKTNFALFGL